MDNELKKPYQFNINYKVREDERSDIFEQDLRHSIYKVIKELSVKTNFQNYLYEVATGDRDKGMSQLNRLYIGCGQNIPGIEFGIRIVAEKNAVRVDLLYLPDRPLTSSLEHFMDSPTEVNL